MKLSELKDCVEDMYGLTRAQKDYIDILLDTAFLLRERTQIQKRLTELGAK